jgi:hypothetical protein
VGKGCEEDRVGGWGLILEQGTGVLIVGCENYIATGLLGFDRRG